MSTDNKVTIYINPEGVGHAFVILNDGVNDTVAGFYPEKKGMPLWTGKVVGKEEIEDSFYQYSYDISKEQYNKISKYIGDIKTTPSLYSIFASPDGDRILQCTSFVKEIIKIGDIPHEYMDNPMPHSLISELYRLIKEPDENKRAIWEKESNKTQGLSEIYNNQTFNIQTLASKLLKPYTIIKTQHNKIKSIKIHDDEVNLIQIDDIVKNTTLIYALEYNQVTLEEALCLPKNTTIYFPKEVKELPNPNGNTTLYTAYDDTLKVVVSNNDGTTTAYDVDPDDIQIDDRNNYQLNLENRIINYSNENFVDTNPNPKEKFLINEIQETLIIERLNCKEYSTTNNDNNFEYTHEM